MKMDEKRYCFYCDGVISASGGIGDHFPEPEIIGGVGTVDCCLGCHDMKDRINISDWSLPWVAKVVSNFPALNRETRIFLAKAMKVMAESNYRNSHII